MTNTTETMKFKRGQRVTWKCEAYLTVACEIMDSRNSYSVQQFLITPLAGEGQKWVNVPSLSEVTL